MIELQRPILLSLPAPAGSVRSAAPGTAVAAPVRRVDPVPGGRPHDRGDAAAWRTWRGADADDADFEEASTGTRRRPRAATGEASHGASGRTARPSDDSWPPEPDGAAAGPLRFGVALGRLAFLAQQVFQESMTAGLHREPWADGIGAYRRAGAEPPLEEGGAVFLSLAV